MQAIAALAVHVEMRRIGRIEMLCLAGVGADGLRPKPVDIAVLDQFPFALTNRFLPELLVGPREAPEESPLMSRFLVGEDRQNVVTVRRRICRPSR